MARLVSLPSDGRARTPPRAFPPQNTLFASPQDVFRSRNALCSRFGETRREVGRHVPDPTKEKNQENYIIAHSVNSLHPSVCGVHATSSEPTMWCPQYVCQRLFFVMVMPGKYTSYSYGLGTYFSAANSSFGAKKSSRRRGPARRRCRRGRVAAPPRSRRGYSEGLAAAARPRTSAETGRRFPRGRPDPRRP